MSICDENDLFKNKYCDNSLVNEKFCSNFVHFEQNNTQSITYFQPYIQIFCKHFEANDF